jgi:dihydrofolate reductase
MNYTMGKMLVMGYNSYVAIGKPLPGRRSIIITHRELATSEDLVIPAHSIEAALSVEQHYPELVVTGGGVIYKETIGLADKLIITHIDADFEADVFFPEIDLSVWKINSVIESCDKNYDYKFVEYIRNENIGIVKGEKS